MVNKRRIRIAAAVVLGGAVMILAAKIVGRWYYDPALWALAGWSVPPDFSDFYLAAEAVLSGRSPYQVDLPQGWLGFVYPPLLAWVMAPLTLLSVPVAVSLWAFLSVLFVMAALWLLGVRDWRCYPVALLWPFNREAIEFGAIDSLLVLAVAACWRYRDASLRASVGAGFAVALKLFLWPLVLWFGLRGRIRTALLSITAAAVLIVVPWALVGFQDLASYPGLVREVSEQQSGSYSLASLAEALEFAAGFAQLLSVVVGAVLLYLAFRAAREPGQDARSRDGRSLTLAIAAALALTPVVWNHYLLLLLVPVAIARPRLSGIWFVPLAATALYLFDWYRPSPEGELLPLLAVTAIAAITLVVAMEAQSHPRSNAVRSLWTGARNRRVSRKLPPALAIGFVLALVFVVVPEKLNDQPYNPLGRDTSVIVEPSGTRP